MIKNILKYQGNEKYICILFLNDKDELFVLYALTGQLNIESCREESDITLNGSKRIAFTYLDSCEIKIPIYKTKNSAFFHIIAIDNEKEYDHIRAVVESLV